MLPSRLNAGRFGDERGAESEEDEKAHAIKNGVQR
jgi:hypothetical protein